jgi:hypothetical protein
MDNNTLPELQSLLATVNALFKTGSGERIAPATSIQAAQELGCEVATGATFTKLIAAIEAEIAKQHTSD